MGNLSKILDIEDRAITAFPKLLSPQNRLSDTLDNWCCHLYRSFEIRGFEVPLGVFILAAFSGAAFYGVNRYRRFRLGFLTSHPPLMTVNNGFREV
ncbi:hypothetical protein MRX96_002635 [Rhipicephalus microplus]